MRRKIISIIISLTLFVTAMQPLYISAASQYETAVTLENVASYEWMKAIRGETRLTEITIPGTHDSCARKFNNDWLVSSTAKCQSLNIPGQLDAGIRFLDIRCEVDSSTYSVKTVHGSADCWDGDDYYYLDFVFQHIYNWLDAHPSETVLVSIKEDDGNAGAAVFTSAVYEYIHGYGQNKYFYGQDYNYHDYWYLGKSVPTLDEVRGKCVLMNRFDQIIATSGSTASEEESGQKVKWGDYSDTSYATPVYANVTNTNTGVGTFHVQDHYKWNTDSKKLATQEMLSLGHYRGEYYFNFSSTVSDSTIPNPSNLAEKVNAGYATFTYNRTKPSGIFAMDFATEELARYIIRNNEAVSTIVQGTDGNISYTLNRLTGELTLTGSGTMNNYAFTSANGVNGMGSTAPWGDQIKNSLFDGQYNTDIITKITVGDGITTIGDYAFYGYDHVTQVTLPSTVTSIGEGAFAKCSSLTTLNIHPTPVTSIGVYAFKDCTALSEFYTSSSVTSIADNAFTNTPNLTMYGENGIYSQSYANGQAIPYVVTDMTQCKVNAKVGNTVKESANPFANTDLSNGVTISFSKHCNADEGWNTSLINFSTGVNTDNRYFIIMANGTILFNDGNGGIGGWNNCYFDINSSAAVNTTSDEWVDIDVTIDKAVNGNHILRYYINQALAAEYNLNNICASGYPNGYSGSDGIFSFLRRNDIKLYYGASFSIYPTMAGTADCYLDRAEFFPYAKTSDEIQNTASYAYLNTFTDSLGGTAVTGRQDGGKSVMLDNSNNDGRTGTAYFPYSEHGGQESNYVATGANPFANADTSNGLTISFWQRINGNYYGNLESITFAQGDLDAKKYFCIGTDGYIRFNHGNGGNDPNYSSAGLYFDHTAANSDITKQVWQFVTFEILDDYHFNIYINGVLSKSVTVSGTANYQANGGLLSFLASGDTSMYFGGYTAYWGNCTLSLDDVYCFTRALKSSEVYALYLYETGASVNGFTDEFDAIPSLFAGGCSLVERAYGRDGVLYIPQGSCNSDIAIYCDSVLLDDNATVLSGKTVTVQYTGKNAVKGWLLVSDSGNVIDTGGASDSFSYTASQNSYALCITKNGAADLFGTVSSGYSDTDNVLVRFIPYADSGTSYEISAFGNSIEYSIAGVKNGAYTVNAYKNNHLDYSGEITVDGSPQTFDIRLLQMGDVNKDYTVDITDIGIILSAAAGSTALTSEQLSLADMNADGKADAFDAAAVDRLAVYSDIPMGDVNLDGEVDIDDYTLIHSYLSGAADGDLIKTDNLDSRYTDIIPLYSEGTVITQQYYSADLDSDTAVDAFDLFFLDKKLNNII